MRRCASGARRGCEVTAYPEVAARSFVTTAGIERLLSGTGILPVGSGTPGRRPRSGRDERAQRSYEIETKPQRTQRGTEGHREAKRKSFPPPLCPLCSLWFVVFFSKRRSLRSSGSSGVPADAAVYRRHGQDAQDARATMGCTSV